MLTYCKKYVILYITKGGEPVKLSFSDKIVYLVITLNVIFAIACLFVCWHTAQSIDALVVAWFAFTTGELWALSSIKKNRLKQNKEV